MHIAIDASRATKPDPTGTERYALELIRHLIPISGAHQVTLYFRDAPADDLLPAASHVTHRTIPFQRAWTHLRFAAALWHDRPDVTFVPAHTLPLAFPGRGVVTLHDLGYKHFPGAHPILDRTYLDVTTRFSAGRASMILADSQATAYDLMQFYGTDKAKIRVVYPGIEPPPVGDLRAVRQKYNLPAQYFLFVGTLQPRKNIQRLVQAFAAAKPWLGAEVGLVLAGAPGWLYDPAWTQGIEGVQVLGYVSDEEKGALMSGALALTFPSLHEGFGFPVLEAMLCGAPVITSASSSLPELVGDVALTVDPTDTQAIAQAMIRLISDDDLRETLRERGPRQAERFTWQACARAALDALEATAR
jgi:glycosyltransferase involved in cell wall biosynthesis